ncbi:MAG: 50S ribosomal protein L6 [Planctomycetota bacterium]|nr:50S ribosomal protein L6 [Planctomycetota bacterium]
MSLIGKKPIPVPAAIKVALNAGTRTVNIQGPKGSLSYIYRPEMIVSWNESTREISCVPDNMELIERGNRRAYWGTTRALIRNMVEGAEKGYSQKLEIVGVGWGAKIAGTKIVLTLGYADQIELKIPTGLTITVEQGVNVLVAGADRQMVFAFASIIRSQRKPEPYKGKGVKYFGEQITRKKGKAFGA